MKKLYQLYPTVGKIANYATEIEEKYQEAKKNIKTAKTTASIDLPNNENEFDIIKKLIEANGGIFISKYTAGGIGFADVYTLDIDDETGEEVIDVAHKMGDLSDIPF